MNQQAALRAPRVLRIPKDKRGLVAVDLGAESCRVSLLRWTTATPPRSLSSTASPTAPSKTTACAGPSPPSKPASMMVCVAPPNSLRTASAPSPSMAGPSTTSASTPTTIPSPRRFVIEMPAPSPRSRNSTQRSRPSACTRSPASSSLASIPSISSTPTTRQTSRPARAGSICPSTCSPAGAPRPSPNTPTPPIPA